MKSFQVARLVYDLTNRFCRRHVERGSRTRDQMVQAARSGVQNIAEASQASGTSKKTELKLTNVARASLEELRLDYEDFLRQGGFPTWPRNDPRRQDLIDRRPETVDEVNAWARDVRHADPGLSAPPSYQEIAANGVLALIAVATSLLQRQLASQAEAFEREGGFTERLYHRRQQRRRDPD